MQRQCETCDALLPEDPSPDKGGRRQRFCAVCIKKRRAADTRRRYQADVEAARAYSREYARTHRDIVYAANKRYHDKKRAERGEEVTVSCAQCQTSFQARTHRRKFCDACLTARRNAKQNAWNREHREEIRAREKTEHHKALHRVAARNYQRRRAAEKRAEREASDIPRLPRAPRRVHKKHLFTVSEQPDGMTIMQCVKCGLAYHIVIQAIVQPQESETTHAAD